jgi:hypothetical protein
MYDDPVTSSCGRSADFASDTLPFRIDKAPEASRETSEKKHQGSEK